jgi:hypothetical protein
LEQREKFRDEEQIRVIKTINDGTSERGQSCNVLGESSQTICGKSGLARETECCEFQWKTRYFEEKVVEVIVVGCNVE